MKAFLMEWSTEILVEAAKQLKDGGIEIAYWLSGFPHLIPKEEFPQTIIHNTFEALRGKGAEELANLRLEALDKDFLESFYKTESLVLMMMQRLHFADILSGLHFSQRKLHYYNYLKYWKAVLEKFKPEAIIFADAPHMICDFIVYCLAKHYGIKTLLFDISRVPGRLILLEDIFQENDSIRKELAKVEKTGLEELPEDLKNYYLQIIQTEKPFYPFKNKLAKIKKKNVYLPNLPEAFKAIFQGGFFSKAKNYFKRLKRLSGALRREKRVKFIKELEKEYKSLQETPDEKEKFILFPLQYQPERTTSPMAGIFCDQILVAQTIASSLPPSWKLYIKEHPLQWKSKKGYMGRFIGYYQAFSQMPNTKIIPIGYPTEKLMVQCVAVVSSTGTAAWEAIFRGVTALVFGWPFYRVAEGVFKISSLQEAQEALLKISQGYKIDKQKLLAFFAALERVSIKAYLGSDYASNNVKVNEKESSYNIAQSILQALKR